MQGSWVTRNAALPERAVRLLKEARWLALCFLAVFLLLILVSYDPHDPGWSRAVW